MQAYSDQTNQKTTNVLALNISNETAPVDEQQSKIKKEDLGSDEDSTDNEPSNIAANDEYAPNACGKHPLHIVLDMLTL